MIGYIGYFYSSMANFRSGYADFQIANRVTILDAQNFDEGSKNELRKGNLLQDLQVSNKIANSIKARCLPKEIKVMDNFIRIVDNQRFCEKIKVDQRKDGRRTLYIPDIRMTEIRAKLKNKKPLTRLERFLLISFGIHLCILKAVNYYIK